MLLCSSLLANKDNYKAPFCGVKGSGKLWH